MIRILDERTGAFIEFLNVNYGTEAECIVSVFNCQDSVCVSEDGKEEQSLFIPEADLIMLTTEKPINGIFDSAGKPAPKFYDFYDYHGDIDSVEVLGNIFDNPELLRGSKKGKSCKNK